MRYEDLERDRDAAAERVTFLRDETIRHRDMLNVDGDPRLAALERDLANARSLLDSLRKRCRHAGSSRGRPGLDRISSHPPE